MPTGTVDIIAPRAIILPDGVSTGHQQISGAIYISGATLVFMPYTGAVPVALS